MAFKYQLESPKKILLMFFKGTKLQEWLILYGQIHVQNKSGTDEHHPEANEAICRDRTSLLPWPTKALCFLGT